MGFFDKIKDKALQKANEALDSAKNKINGATSGITEKMPIPGMNKPAAAPQEYASDQYEGQYASDQYEGQYAGEYDDQYTGDYDEFDQYGDEDYNVVDDSAFDELNDWVDAALENGELDDYEYENLSNRATELGIQMDEFEMMMASRMEEMQQMMAEHNDYNYYRSRRSVWRRCPNCGHLALVEDDYCDWCGCCLRLNPVQSAIALGLMAASRSQNRMLRNQRALRRNIAAKTGLRKMAPTRKANPVRPMAARPMAQRPGMARPMAQRPGMARPMAPRPGMAPRPAAARPMGLGAKPAAPDAKKPSLFGGSKPAAPAAKKPSLFGGSKPAAPTAKKSSLFGASKAMSTAKKSSALGSLAKSATKTKKSGGLLGSVAKSAGKGLLKAGKKRR